MFGFDDVYARLKPFAMAHRGSAAAQSTFASLGVRHCECCFQSLFPVSLHPPSSLPSTLQEDKTLYMASVDVEDCFNSIKHDKLFEVVGGLLSEDEYGVRRFGTVHTAGGCLRKTFHREVFLPGDFQQVSS